jgi:predicted RNA-binding Zn-ribbon protein involved in translation (DUF1610 family)
LENLILRLLEKNPVRRPQSANEVHEELERLIAAYWPIIRTHELRTTIGAKASLVATQPRSLVQHVRQTPHSRATALVPVDRTSGSFRCTKCGCLIRIDTTSMGKTLPCPACWRGPRRLQPLDSA